MIYGQDHRREYHELEAPLQALASRVVAIAPRTAKPVPLGEAWQLCESERFYEQPHLATCSGVLISDDLVLTAAHCMPTQAACEQLEALRGFAYMTPGADPLSAARHLPCLEVVALAKSLTIFRVERQTELVPITFASGTPCRADVTVNLGYPGGIPLKGDVGGQIVNSEHCWVSSDAFAGSSGSPLFNARLELMGVLLGGEIDLEQGEACRVVRRLPDEQGRERVLSMPRVAATLCKTESAELRALMCPQAQPNTAWLVPAIAGVLALFGVIGSGVWFKRHMKDSNKQFGR